MLHSELFIPPVTNLLFLYFHVAPQPRPSPPMTCHGIELLFIFTGFHFIFSLSYFKFMRRDPHLFSEPLAYFNSKGDWAADAPFEFRPLLANGNLLLCRVSKDFRWNKSLIYCIVLYITSKHTPTQYSVAMASVTVSYYYFCNNLTTNCIGQF